ncbi:DUF3188 domain-containing protein [Lapidilactobacillus bayanensis]|uniref:DUF3188 domain-containing protein n=1 Tax=Lapidilactobacillus bayanensis TaxID=2485998 RepID=UPI000F7941B5|nr:DUF3188 domain-containing protein [Lapidilactobacillus bayanensis]
MATNGLFLMAIGFAMIMMSPANHNINQVRLGILTLGIAFVAAGFYFYRRGRKNEKAQAEKHAHDADTAVKSSNESTAKKVTKK